MREWSERRKAIAFGAVLVAAVLGLLWAGEFLNRVDVSGMPVVRDVSMRIEGAAMVLWYNVSATRNVTAFAFLLEAAEAKGFSVNWFAWGPPLSGVFVTSIGDDVNGEGDRYWQFWIDGRYATAGADHVVLHDGASIEWRFVPSLEG